MLVGCPKNCDIKDAEKVFEKICLKNLKIIAVESCQVNIEPVCRWRVHYQRKSEEYLEEYEESKDIVHPSGLPRDQAFLKGFFDDLTRLGPSIMDLEIVEGKEKTNNISVVEYYPRACECKVPKSEAAIEESHLKKIEIKFKNLKMWIIFTWKGFKLIFFLLF